MEELFNQIKSDTDKFLGQADEFIKKYKEENN